MRWRDGVIGLGLIILLLAGLAWWAVQPPPDFPLGEVVEIRPGSTLATVSRELGERGVIRLPGLFRRLVAYLPGEGSVQAGLYQFERPLPLGEIVRRVTAGQQASDLVKVTIPEGLTGAEMAAIFKKHFPAIDERELAIRAEAEQGYLFPDTYFLPPAITAGQAVEQLRARFDAEIAKLEAAISDSGHSLAEVVAMASVVEEELSEPRDRRIIAGILWKRLENKMPLQVDVERATYDYAGLPSRPIANPGRAALVAVLEPIATDYWFYLSASDGTTHYAKTYEEHRRNIDKFLRTARQ